MSIDEKSFKGYGILTSPFFVPVVVIILLQLTINLFYIFVPVCDLAAVIYEGGLISKLSTAGYLLLFAAFIWIFFDFLRFGNFLNYWIFLFLALGAFAREQELFRWAMGQKNVAFNLKFILDASQPLLARIFVTIIFLMLALIFIYLARKYTALIIKEFFYFGTIAWSFATFAICLLLGQFLDWFQSKSIRFTGIDLSSEFKLKLEIIEECTEILLPLIIIIIFVQYHFLLKKIRTIH
ncbi:MAG: hypothetical protein LBP59_19530 [Planctomycetaceae bacterium]|jgi:hypothetical protein|nr:hypothetical protein [Planctomycetaceae bacterium]